MKSFVKIAGIVALAMAVTGCGQLSRAGAGLTGYSKTCVDGVTYIQFPSGAVVQRDANDKIVPCKKP